MIPLDKMLRSLLQRRPLVAVTKTYCNVRASSTSGKLLNPVGYLVNIKFYVDLQFYVLSNDLPVPVPNM